MSYDLARLLSVYEGSDAEASKALYAALEALGPAGIVARFLLSAEKASVRAKKYRGGDSRGSFRGQAYQRKGWAMEQLAEVLGWHAPTLGIRWGWGIDAKQDFHRDVLYVDIPTGQVSFHTAGRGAGPDYPVAWDGAKGLSESRIITWAVRLFAAAAAAVAT